MRTFFFALISSLALAATAAGAAGVSGQALDKLFAQLRRVETPEDAKPIEAQILASFTRSGSPSIDLLMSRADAAETVGNKDVARHLFLQVTILAPRFAEGWHRRAQIQQEGGDDTAALLSLQKTVELNPRHFEAMTELGEMLEGYGKKAEALTLYRKALALDPYFEGLQHHIDALSRDVEGQGI